MLGGSCWLPAAPDHVPWMGGSPWVPPQPVTGAELMCGLWGSPGAPLLGPCVGTAAVTPRDYGGDAGVRGVLGGGNVLGMAGAACCTCPCTGCPGGQLWVLGSRWGVPIPGTGLRPAAAQEPPHPRAGTWGGLWGCRAQVMPPQPPHDGGGGAGAGGNWRAWGGLRSTHPVSCPSSQPPFCPSLV